MIVFLLDPARSMASTPNLHSVWGGAWSVTTVIWAHAARDIEHDAASDTILTLPPTPRIRTPQLPPECGEDAGSCSRTFYNRRFETRRLYLSRNTRAVGGFDAAESRRS